MDDATRALAPGALDSKADPAAEREERAQSHQDESTAQNDAVEIDFGAADVVALARFVERPKNTIRAARVRKVAAGTALGDDALVLRELATPEDRVAGSEHEQGNAGHEEPTLVRSSRSHTARLTPGCARVNQTLHVLPMREPLVWRELGLCAYEHALEMQGACWEARRSGGPETCLVLEHPPTITLGRRTDPSDLLARASELAAHGIACVATERGGGPTYHGPGQLVLYPILDLAARGLGVRRFVWLLEEIMIDLAGTVGVAAARDSRGRGVWTATGKLGAVGIRVREGVSMHGLALNVDLDLSPYRLIAPCGVRGLPVTSLTSEGARGVTVRHLLPAGERVCRQLFDVQFWTREEARA